MTFIINATGLPINAAIFLSSSQTLTIPRELRKIFALRLFIGWILVFVYVIGSTLVPLTVQQTLTNTTPFWASIIGYCAINERLSFPVLVAMLISFVGVVLVTYDQSRQQDAEGGDQQPEMTLFKDKAALAGLVGCLCVLTHAFINGVVSVQTRLMQEISVPVTLFYIAFT